MLLLSLLCLISGCKNRMENENKTSAKHTMEEQTGHTTEPSESSTMDDNIKKDETIRQEDMEVIYLEAILRGIENWPEQNKSLYIFEPKNTAESENVCVVAFIEVNSHLVQQIDGQLTVYDSVILGYTGELEEYPDSGINLLEKEGETLVYIINNPVSIEKINED